MFDIEVSEDMCFESVFPEGGHLDFSYLTELKNIYITEIYMKKNNTNHK